MGWPTDADIERHRIDEAERQIKRAEDDWSYRRIAELEAALRELSDACIAEFGDGEDAPREPDDSSVFAGVPDGQGITFGMLRRARAALAI
jgi:hypothetical protein